MCPRLLRRVSDYFSNNVDSEDDILFAFASDNDRKTFWIYYDLCIFVNLYFFFFFSLRPKAKIISIGSRACISIDTSGGSETYFRGGG